MMMMSVGTINNQKDVQLIHVHSKIEWLINENLLGL